MNDRPVVFERHVKIEAGGGQSDVVISIWQAQPLPVESEESPASQCDFEITGLPETVRSRGIGVDSMQALVSALNGVTHYLRPYRDSLTWLGMPYDEVPLYIHVEDAGRRRRIEEILDEEEYAITKRGNND